MILRIRALFVSAALVAALGVVAVVQAQDEVPASPDAATVAALAQWRAQALTLVSPSFQGAVAAMYADQPIDPGMVNAASAAKAQAEQAAWATLDKTSTQLIENYFSQVESAEFVAVTSTNEDQ